MTSNVCRTEYNVPMKNYTSMKTGGIAKTVFFPKNEKEMSDTVKLMHSNGRKYVVFGNLSNVLVPDEGFDIPVVMTGGMSNTRTLSEDEEKTLIYADCGASYTKLALDCCKAGLSGLEFAYGIPGTVGGAVIMNAGAYGGETKDVVQSVTAVGPDGAVHEFSNSLCGFDYRKSVFSDGEFVVTGAVFRLTRKNADECVAAAKEFMSRRVEKQPLEYPSCGSTFKRPEGFFAGALIEKSGLKGANVGGAYISEKHAGFVINKENGSTKDVVSLMKLVSDKVFMDSGVRLEPEIRMYDKNGEPIEL